MVRRWLWLRNLDPLLVSTKYDLGSLRDWSTETDSHVLVVVSRTRMGYPEYSGVSVWPLVSVSLSVRWFCVLICCVDGVMWLGRFVINGLWKSSSLGLGVLVSIGVARPDSLHFFIRCLLVPTFSLQICFIWGIWGLMLCVRYPILG